MSEQRIAATSGRIIGRQHSEGVDGGMELASYYANRYRLAADAFWEDMRLLKHLGLAEQLVRPAPGRKAVYALVLRTDAIPNGLPEDLARALRVYDLPEPEPEDEDTRYGHLTDSQPVAVAQVVAEPDLPLTLTEEATFLTELAAAPRWEHPEGTSAAIAAAEISRSSKALGAQGGVRDLRCTAVRSNTGERLMQRFGSRSETTPLYPEGYQPSGFGSSAGSWWSGCSIRDGQDQKRTPSAAARTRSLLPAGPDLAAVADRVLRDVWAAWRRELGRGKVILRSTDREASGAPHAGSAWEDLRRTVEIALRRTTPGDIVDILTASITNADDLGRVAGWRLWKLINTKRNAQGYGRRAQVQQALHVTLRDDHSASYLADRREWFALCDQRRREADAARAEQLSVYERWAIWRLTEPREPTPPKEFSRTVDPRSQAVRAGIVRPQTGGTARERAVLERARADKRARKTGLT
ncbi:hypothetical protein [Streptomyces sp. cg36]|uniref:hypothetical protein n=1 Tax=Streptomyces sp. cg36 TaxID=3238798 RepID=UPI0034E224F4